MVIEPKIIGGVCLTAHPEGLRKALEEQIAYVKSRPPIDMPRRVLVIGGSTGYGLATRAAAAFGGGAATLNVSFEREPTHRKPAGVGWYNNKYFDQAAAEAGIPAESIIADAFSDETRGAVLSRARDMLGQVDLLVYSVASPMRKDPKTGITHKSVLKPIGAAYRAKSVDFLKGIVGEASVEPAEGEDELNTVKVMGGEDWTLWVDALLDANLLAEGAKTVAYSYIGPEVTHAVYRAGTIGAAKEHLERSAGELNTKLQSIGGEAFVSVNKALVTRASSVIPVVPLYISLLYRVMKEKGLHEGCIEQMYRMLSDKIYGSGGTLRDSEGLVRLDDWEMRDDVQAEVSALWDSVNTENLESLTDITGFRDDFMHLHGFGWDGVDYSAEVDTFG